MASQKAAATPQQELGVKPNRWTAKDVITLVVFNVIIIAFTMIVKTVIDLLVSPGLTIYFSAALFGLLTTPFYMVMAYRIHKRGVAFFSMVIFGLLFTFMGMTYYAPVYLIGAFIAEAVMWGKDSYRKPVRITAGFCVYWTTFCISGVIPFIFFRDTYITSLSSSYPAWQVELIMNQYTDPLMICIMIGTALIGVCVGGWIGSKLLNKHVKKAKLA